MTEDLSTHDKRVDYVNNVLRKQPKQRIKVDYGIRDMYEHYKKLTVGGLQKPYSVFKKIIKELNEEIAREVLTSKEIKFPCSLGYLRIKKTKMSFKDTNKLRINWKETKDKGCKVYHTNDHRNNFRYKFLWTKQRLTGITPYSFIPSRNNKRTLAKILLTNKDIDFFE